MKSKYTSQNSTEWEDNVIFDSDDPDFVLNNEEVIRVIVPSWSSRQSTNSFTLRGECIKYYNTLYDDSSQLVVSKIHIRTLRFYSM